MLSPLTSKIKEKNIVSFDIETYGEDNNFLMGSIYSEYKIAQNKNLKFEKVFWNKFEMIEYIINESKFYKNTYITATNLGFDLLSLVGDTSILKDFKMIFRNSHLITAKYKNDNFKKNLTFVDTLNYSKISVEHMGKILNIPKLPHPICFKNKPKDTTELIEMENYNKRDTLITYKFAKMLQDGFNNIGCNMKLTIASTSMDLFKRRFLNQFLDQNETSIPFLYNAYYGARCEVIKRGYIHDLFYYDFNNMYGSCFLKDYPYPNKEYYSEKITQKILLNKNYNGIVKIKMKIEDIELPYLPYRLKYNPKNKNSGYKLIFPIGEFTGYYTFFEIRKALKLGYEILDIYDGIYYTDTFKPFKDYINIIYPLKEKYKKQGSPLSEVYKILANSLYGKFAQKIDSREKIFHIDSLEHNKLKEYLENEKKYKSIIRGNFVYVTEKIIPYIPTFIIPIFSIYTTAYARDKLYNKIIETGVDNVYYYDTDSLITSKPLENSSKLGELKLEYFIKDGILVSPKMYYINTNEKPIIKIKGVPKRLDDNRTLNKLEFMNLLSTHNIEYNKFVKFKEANSRNLKYNQILKVPKTFALEDTKRIWYDKFDPLKLEISSPRKVIE